MLLILLISLFFSYSHFSNFLVLIPLGVLTFSFSHTHTTNSLLSLLLILFSHSFSLSNMELITDLDLMHSFAYIILSFSISITHSVHSTHSLFAFSVHLLPFSHTPLLLRCHSSSLLLSHSSNSPSVSFTHSYTYILSFIFSSTLLLSHSSTSRHTLSLSYTPLLIFFSPSQSQSPTLSILRTLSVHSLFPYFLFHTLLYINVFTLFSYSLTPQLLDTLCLVHTLLCSYSSNPNVLLLRCSYSVSLILSYYTKSHPLL